MGRPPCCEKTGVKKGPWSPEEDISLVSYVQEHGPGNWSAVPANTGLMRCSKSCRLRWTNYLRPGIKRGNFSDQEEKLIVELQKLLGNKWSTIASYLPERTDNDIKNYWNTHLKKKLAKTAGAREDGASSSRSAKTKRDRAAAPANKQGRPWEQFLQTDFRTARQAFHEALSMDTAPQAIKPELPLPEPPAVSPAMMYAYSIDNIARLLELEGWMHPSACVKPASTESMSSGTAQAQEGFTGMAKVRGASGAGPGPSSSSLPTLDSSWLFDDGTGHGDAGSIYMPLADPGEFF